MMTDAANALQGEALCDSLLQILWAAILHSRADKRLDQCSTDPVLRNNRCQLLYGTTQEIFHPYTEKICLLILENTNNFPLLWEDQDVGGEGMDSGGEAH